MEGCHTPTHVHWRYTNTHSVAKRRHAGNQASDCHHHHSITHSTRHKLASFSAAQSNTALPDDVFVRFSVLNSLVHHLRFNTGRDCQSGMPTALVR